MPIPQPGAPRLGHCTGPSWLEGRTAPLPAYVLSLPPTYRGRRAGEGLTKRPDKAGYLELHSSHQFSSTRFACSKLCTLPLCTAALIQIRNQSERCPQLGPGGSARLPANSPPITDGEQSLFVTFPFAFHSDSERKQFYFAALIGNC